MENNNTDKPKQNFWKEFFSPSENELSSNDRYRPAELMAENNQLKKKVKELQTQLEKAQARATSYAVVIEHQLEQLHHYKSKFQ